MHGARHGCVQNGVQRIIIPEDRIPSKDNSVSASDLLPLVLPEVHASKLAAVKHDERLCSALMSLDECVVSAISNYS